MCYGVQEGDVYDYNTSETGSASLRIFWRARKVSEQKWMERAVDMFVIDVNGKMYMGMMVGRSHITEPTQEIDSRFVGRSDGSRIGASHLETANTTT